MATFRELQEFPTIFTFKMVGVAGDEFKKNVSKIFELSNDVKIISKESSEGKYCSYSATLEVKTYEELENYYKNISALKGLKFHV